MGCVLLEYEGGFIRVCGGKDIKPCNFCMRWAGWLCDWPMGRGKTCDALLCDRHAIDQGPVPEERPAAEQLRLFETEEPSEEPTEHIHFCPTHAAMARAGTTPRS